MLFPSTCSLFPRITLLLGLALSSLAATHAEELELHWPNGNLRAKYGVDSQGRRSGAYLEYYEDGTLKLKTRYRANRLEGKYESYFEDGERELRVTYKAGLLHGKYEEFSEDGSLLVKGKYASGAREGDFSWFAGDALRSKQQWKQGQLVQLDGLVPYPRSLESLRATLAVVYDPEQTKTSDAKAPSDEKPKKKSRSKKKASGHKIDADGDLSEKQRVDQDLERDAALRRLMAYRFLCGLEWSDMRLDDDYNHYASMAARLLVHVGELDHTPKNPGIPNDEYREGYTGTSSSNLSLGSNLPGSIDGYMDDSDPSNIDRVGHRLWCLNPAMLRTGFGRRGSFSAMWSFDASRGKVPSRRFVAYPAAGYFPVEYFGDRHAWSVQIAGKTPQLGTAEVRVYEVNDEFVRSQEPLELDHLGVSRNALVFRPVGVLAVPGKRYWVEVDGVGSSKGRKALRYFVEFVAEHAEED